MNQIQNTVLAIWTFIGLAWIIKEVLMLPVRPIFYKRWWPIIKPIIQAPSKAIKASLRILCRSSAERKALQRLNQAPPPKPDMIKITGLKSYLPYFDFPIANCFFKDDLKEMCKACGLSTKGTKRTLASRLGNHQSKIKFRVVAQWKADR